MIVGRLAPSPTGRMHAGNVFASLMAWLVVKSQGGRIVLRIEDLDAGRSRAEYADALQRDFERLGLVWDDGPYFQHDRREAYHDAYQSLAARGIVYPCFCTRSDVHAASAPHRGQKVVYPGTCRRLTESERETLGQGRTPTRRLTVPDQTIAIHDLVQGPFKQNLQRECGDFLIRRADGTFAYQLAVVVDDAEQGVNSVVRGVDLLCSTPQQVHLQTLLSLPHPVYAHVPLFVVDDGRRLAKRDGDAALDVLLARFGTPEAVIGHIANLAGLAPTNDPTTPEKLLREFDPSNLSSLFPDPMQILWR